MNRRRVVIWLAGALLPAVFLSIAWYFQAVPLDVRQSTVDLRGEWMLHEGDDSSWAGDIDDSAWKTAKVPGLYSAQGFKAKTAWYRKSFDLPEKLADKTLYVTLGDTRGGFARVFVNGHYIGEQGNVEAQKKGFIHALDGWEVPATYTRHGRNTIAVRIVWLAGRFDGLMDSRIMIGDAAHLKPYQLAVADMSGFLRMGFVYLAGALIILLAALLAIEWSSGDRYLYVSTMMLIVSCASYVMFKDGIFLGWVRFQNRCDLVFVSVALMLLACWEMVEHYFLHRVTWGRQVARLVLGVLALLSTAPMVGAKISSFDVYDFALAPAGTLVVVTLIPMAIWGVIKGQREFAPVFAVGLVAMGLAAANDILTDLNVLQSPALYSYSLTGLPIGASAVMFADFLGLHQRNKELSTSLSTTNQELAVALAQAQESTRLKSEFLATVSHELRTPLNAIINIPDGLAADFKEHELARCEKCGAQAVLEPGDEVAAGTPCPACAACGTLSVGKARLYEGDSEETIRYLSSIKRSGKHLLSIVTDILDLSKLEVGRMVLHRETLTVDRLVEELSGAVEPLAKQRNIVITFPPAGTVDVMMLADPVKLSQVFINLLGNAIKFSPDGGSIEFKATRTDDAVLFAVTDHGIGIAPENHELIFERFRQVDASHTRSFGGTGLGLAITKELVLLHGGQIWVESELGKGATFYVRLPLSEEKVAGDQAAPTAEPARDPNARTILVIDDDPMVVETVRLGLRGIKANIVSVGDPRQASSLIESLEPDLVILDIMMPRVSGLSILKDIKRNPRRKDIPVVVASAYDANREMVSALGASWVDKPWDANTLAKLVQPVISGTGNNPKGST